MNDNSSIQTEAQKKACDNAYKKYILKNEHVSKFLESKVEVCKQINGGYIWYFIYFQLKSSNRKHCRMFLIDPQGKIEGNDKLF